MKRTEPSGARWIGQHPPDVIAAALVTLAVGIAQA
jgi:hypothetical protein